MQTTIWIDGQKYDLYDKNITSDKRLLLVVKFNKTARKFVSPCLGPNLAAKQNPNLKRKS